MQTTEKLLKDLSDRRKQNIIETLNSYQKDIPQIEQEQYINTEFGHEITNNQQVEQPNPTVPNKR